MNWEELRMWLLYAVELLIVITFVGFLVAYLWESLSPSSDKPRYRKTDGYFPKYELPPPPDDEK